jgi:RNA 2',3'-cyclic 3'-phosphodiesterase
VWLPADVAAAVDAAIEPLRAALPRARWTPPAHRHVTLLFLGRTERRLLPWIEGSLAEAAARMPVFEVRVHGLGAFPRGRRARVLWAGFDDPAEALVGLAGAVQDALAAEFPPARRAFGAHVTVARCDPPVAFPKAYADTRVESEPFEVREMALVRSHLGGAAPRYATLATFPLTGSSGHSR